MRIRTNADKRQGGCVVRLDVRVGLWSGRRVICNKLLWR